MGLPVEINNLMMGAVGGYQVGRSLRFRSSASAYLNRTPASATNRTTWTWSGWVKRGSLTADLTLFQGYSDANNYTVILFDSGDKIQIQNRVAATATFNWVTTAVYRDPSAWYHVVVIFDTTQATSTDRIKLYVNGVQITAFSTQTTGAQNATGFVNNNNSHNIGRSGAATQYFDGYLAEVNFIDGQALTPSSFGSTDVNGIWQPKKYTGTYGTNGFYLPFNWSTSTSYAGSFNGSTQYLTVPTNSAFDFGSGDFTIEAWVLTDTTSNRNIVAREYTGNGSNYTGYIFSTTQVVASTSGSGWEVNFTWSLPSANQWHHYALVRNGNVYSVYIDGIRVGTQTVSGTLINGFGGAFTIGYRNGQSLPSGSMSNIRVVKGTAVYTGNFTPPTSSLTAISGTSLLTLQSSTVIDNSTNAFTITNVGSVAMAASSPFGASILADASGNNNGWSGNNINYSAYGTTYDSMLDVPTNNSATAANFAVLSPINITSGYLVTDGNLNANSNTAAWRGAGGSIGVSSGKWYWELAISGGSNLWCRAGIASVNLTNYNVGGTFPDLNELWVYNNTNGQKYNGTGGAGVAYGATWTTNDVIGVAFDAGAGTLTFYKNNVSQGTAYTGLTNGPYFPALLFNNTTGWINFGQRPFSYTPPTGFVALNTYNLPAPSIKVGAQYMAATTYTSNGGVQSISNSVNGFSFQPDLVWQKRRNSAGSHYFADSIRGVSKLLSSDTTAAEATNTTFLTSFNSDGWSQGTGNYTNGESIVGWQWKGGGTAVSNNSGTITSSVSANASAGFSVVTYTGTGSAATVGHGLGVAPSMIIARTRNSAVNWAVGHNSLTSWSYWLALNLTNAQSLNTNLWNGVAPTSSVFSIGIGGTTNASGESHVAYCFAAVSGYSAFGSYTGNGSSDGPFVYLGFAPKFILIKQSSAAGQSWIIWDTTRQSYNVIGPALYPDLSNAENTPASNQIDILSSGFKLRNGTGTATNGSGSTYIYAAFAENPFQLARAR